MALSPDDRRMAFVVAGRFARAAPRSALREVISVLEHVVRAEPDSPEHEVRQVSLAALQLEQSGKRRDPYGPMVKVPTDMNFWIAYFVDGRDSTVECPNCMYDLRGLTPTASHVRRCPECGLLLPSPIGRV